ncbi:MAG: Ig-like domain-containing protein, partial [Actinomycetota bacterium]|nr:Ig-like domain-containing protein [Actinomycetota bacterium]
MKRRLRTSLVGTVVGSLVALGTAPATGTLFQVGTTPSVTELSSSANPSVIGQAVTYKARVADDPADGAAGLGIPTGTVDFSEGDAVVCEDVLLDAAGEGTCSITYRSAGGRRIKATYSGDPNFAASESPVLRQTVNRVKTSTTLSSSDGDNRTVSGQAVTYP